VIISLIGIICCLRQPLCFTQFCLQVFVGSATYCWSVTLRTRSSTRTAHIHTDSAFSTLAGPRY